MADYATGGWNGPRAPAKPCQSAPPAAERPDLCIGGDGAVPFAAAAQAAWESVLSETAEVENPDASLGPAEYEALRGVAKHYRGQALALQPVASALVQAVILPHMPADPAAAQFWQDVFVQIAQTQWEDQAARRRLDALWTWLQGDPEICQQPAS
jgi:hypothetical protein